MDLRTLRYFVAVAEELHFGRAAQRLHMAQPPLSQQIRKLELELGVQLFTRNKRSVALTQPGEFLLESARLILLQTQTAVAGVRAAGKGLVGNLAIGLINAVTFQGEIFAVLREFRERHPGVATSLKVMTSVEQIAALQQGQIHLGFLRAPVHERTITAETIMTEELLVALPPQHPLAQREGPVHIRELSQEPFVMLPRSAGFGLSEQTLRICKRGGFIPHISQEASELQTLCGLVAAGFGISLVPSSALIVPIHGTVYKALEPSETLDTVAAYSAIGRPPALEAFLGILRHHPSVISTLSRPAARRARGNQVTAGGE